MGPHHPLHGWLSACSAPVLRESDPTILQRVHGKRNRGQVLFGSLTRKGLLPHLAIAANDPERLARLFKLANHPQYRRYRLLNSMKMMRCTVMLNREDMLETIRKLREIGALDLK